MEKKSKLFVNFFYIRCFWFCQMLSEVIKYSHIEILAAKNPGFRRRQFDLWQIFTNVKKWEKTGRILPYRKFTNTFDIETFQSDYHHAMSDFGQPGICYQGSRHMASSPNSPIYPRILHKIGNLFQSWQENKNKLAKLSISDPHPSIIA